MPSSNRDIQILLSTYNGSEFIAAQLHSIVAQDCAERISVLIRDDGSTDDTVNVINSMDTAPLSVHVIEGSNLGAKASFLDLMNKADTLCSFFFFCDQDDVWSPDKVSTAVGAIEHFTGPALYCGRSTITDINLTPMGLTAPVPRGPSFRNALIQNIAPGHTMAFNSSLLTMARESFPPDQAIMHDHWMYLLATGLGTVTVDSTPHAQYRMHPTNQIGYEASAISHFIGRLRRVFSLNRSIYTRQDRAIEATVGELLPADAHAALLGFLDQETLASRWAYLRRFPLVHQSRSAAFMATVLFLLGRYNDKRRLGSTPHQGRKA